MSGPPRATRRSLEPVLACHTVRTFFCAGITASWSVAAEKLLTSSLDDRNTANTKNSPEYDETTRTRPFPFGSGVSFSKSYLDDKLHPGRTAAAAHVRLLCSTPVIDSH